jgi:GGDEF domain-containing protein
VPRAVGHRIAGSVRPTDTVARVGGDEFVVLASVVDAGQAADLARRGRLRRAVGSLGGPDPGRLTGGYSAFAPAQSPTAAQPAVARRSRVSATAAPAPAPAPPGGSVSR